MTVFTTHLGKVVDVSAGQPAPKPNEMIVKKSTPRPRVDTA
jgi:hypothetical protein